MALDDLERIGMQIRHITVEFQNLGKEELFSWHKALQVPSIGEELYIPPPGGRGRGRWRKVVAVSWVNSQYAVVMLNVQKGEGQ